MTTTRVRIDPRRSVHGCPRGRIDPARVDATTEAEIALQERRGRGRGHAGHGAIRAPGPAPARSVADRARAAPSTCRTRTIRNWEQGKRCPTGAARALLRVLDRAPETALRVLT